MKRRIDFLKANPKTTAIGFTALGTLIALLRRYGLDTFLDTNHIGTFTGAAALFLLGLQGLFSGDAKPSIPASQVQPGTEVMVQPESGDK